MMWRGLVPYSSFPIFLLDCPIIFFSFRSVDYSFNIVYTRGSVIVPYGALLRSARCVQGTGGGVHNVVCNLSLHTVTRFSILTDNDSSWFSVSYSQCVTVSRGAIWIVTPKFKMFEHIR